MQPPGFTVPNIHQHEQLVNNDSCSSVFSISNPQNQPHHFYHHQQQQQHPQHSQQQQHKQIFSQQRQQQQQQHSFPNTHQLFQQQQFQALQLQNERLHQQIRLEQEPGQAPHHFFPVNFKLGLNENSGNKESVLNQEENAFLHGNEHNVSQNRPHSLVIPHCWHPQEDSAIKESFWKQLNRSNNNNKHCNEGKEQQPGSNKSKYHKSLQQVDDSKYRLFNELEAIYSLAKIGESNQAAGSGSALTGSFSDVHHENVGAIGGANNAIGVDHGSETSIGEEASLRKIQKRKRKRKLKENWSSMAGFLESLVKQVMDHQECLHRRFLEVIERMDKERTEREEARKRQEAAKYNREAFARAQEQALVSSREGLIVQYLERITGQSINLSTSKAPLLLQPQNSQETIKELTPLVKVDTNSRWPKAEVEALIQLRSGLESKFQEPGLKAPLWEEISSLMATMGYQRSAKRCKEKWENINKYFKKTKESAKKYKSCSYFDQLDQLYSRTPINCNTSSSRPIGDSTVGVQSQSYSELLEAFVAGRNLGIEQNPSSGDLMGSSKLDCDGIVDEKDELEQGSHEKEKENHGNDQGMDGEGGEDDDGVKEIEN